MDSLSSSTSSPTGGRPGSHHANHYGTNPPARTPRFMPPIPSRRLETPVHELDGNGPEHHLYAYNRVVYGLTTDESRNNQMLVWCAWASMEAMQTLTRLNVLRRNMHGSFESGGTPFSETLRRELHLNSVYMVNRWLTSLARRLTQHDATRAARLERFVSQTEDSADIATVFSDGLKLLIA